MARTLPPLHPSAPGWRKALRALRRDDLTLAALGVTLAVLCAIFPWYIFFNQEKFSPPAVSFDGTGEGSPRSGSGGKGRAVGALIFGDPVDPLHAEDLDLFATGSTPEPEEEKPAPDAEAEPQPFPAEPVEFRVVYVANGRAMIDDGASLFIVGPGDVLPDNSTVSRVVEGAKSAVVTSNDETLSVGE